MTIGPLARQASNHEALSFGPRRSAPSQATIRGTRIQGRRERISPPRYCSRQFKLNPSGAPRPAWNANEIQRWVMFQQRTGEKTAAAASSPNQGPGVLNQCRERASLTRNTKAPAKKKIAVYLDS